MEKFNLENKIIERIKEEKIEPKSIWYFLARDTSLWILVALSILLVSLTLAPIIFILSNFEFEYIGIVAPNIFIFILNFFPFFWFALSFVAIFFAKEAWQRTKNGYKFSGKNVVVISALISFIIALSLNIALNVGKKIDDEAGRRGPGFMQSFEERRKERWNKKDEGRVFGKVLELSTSTLVLERKTGSDSFATETIKIIPETLGLEMLDKDNFVRILTATDTLNNLVACAVLEDKFLPPHKKVDMKKEIENTFEANSICKKKFERK